MEAVYLPLLSALVAALLSFLGVMISNRHSLDRLRIQLETDSANKREDRMLTLRRETFLQFAAELRKTNSALVEPPTEDEDPVQAIFREFGAATAKAEVVAEGATALLINQLHHQYGSLHLERISWVPRLRLALVDCRLAKTDVEAALDRTKTDVARYASLAEDPTVDFEKFQNHERATEEAIKSHKKFGLEMEKANSAFMDLLTTFSQHMLGEQQKVHQITIDVLVALRKDLKLESDKKAIEDHVAKSSSAMNTQMGDVLKKVRES